MDGSLNWSEIAFVPPGSPTRIADIITATSLHFRVTESEIKGGSRRREYARARQIVMFLSREMTGASFPMIGRLLGNKHHTSILWGARVIGKMVNENREDMATHVKAIRELVLSGNPKLAARKKHQLTIELVAEREAEEAIRHNEKMRQLRRIRDLANAGFIATDAEKRVMSS